LKLVEVSQLPCLIKVQSEIQRTEGRNVKACGKRYTKCNGERYSVKA